MGYLYVLLALAFWGLNFVVARGMVDVVPPAALAFYRWGIAAVLLLPALPALWKLRAALRRDWQPLLVASVTGVASFHVCIYVGAHTAGVYNLPLVAAFSGVFVMLGSRFVGRTPSWIQLAGSLLACGGLAVLIGRGELKNLLALRFVPGDVWMLLGALVWAIYSLTLDKLKLANPLLGHMAMILMALPFLGVIYGAEAYMSGPFRVDAKVAGVLLFLAVFPSLVCYWLWITAIQKIGAVRAHALYYAIPLITAVEAWLLLNEQLHWYHFVSGALIVCGAALAVYRKPAPAERPGG